jgi:hypothetical protein
MSLLVGRYKMSVLSLCRRMRNILCRDTPPSAFSASYSLPASTVSDSNPSILSTFILIPSHLSTYNTSPSFDPSNPKTTTMDPSTQLDPSKLSETDKKELNQFISNEAQKSTIQQSIPFLPLAIWLFFFWLCCFYPYPCRYPYSPGHPLLQFMRTSCGYSERVMLTYGYARRPPPRRQLLEEMHHREDLCGAVGELGGGVCGELCRAVDGYQHVRLEAFGGSSGSVG